MYEPLAQLVEHLTFNQRVEGSSPSWLTSFFKESRLADVAQLVERRLAKAKVAGSRPVVRSIFTKIHTRNRVHNTTCFSGSGVFLLLLAVYKVSRLVAWLRFWYDTWSAAPTMLEVL